MLAHDFSKFEPPPPPKKKKNYVGDAARRRAPGKNRIRKFLSSTTIPCFSSFAAAGDSHDVTSMRAKKYCASLETASLCALLMRPNQRDITPNHIARPRK